ncbi:MAG: hypothetical protein Q3993_05760 [Filifactor alocis]|nr:hypothetical protein [Filifactor alocis]
MNSKKIQIPIGMAILYNILLLLLLMQLFHSVYFHQKLATATYLVLIGVAYRRDVEVRRSYSFGKKAIYHVMIALCLLYSFYALFA